MNNKPRSKRKAAPAESINPLTLKGRTARQSDKLPVSPANTITLDIDQFAQLVTTLVNMPTPVLDEEDDDWSLTPEQMLFMLKHNNEIELAFKKDDFDALERLAQSDVYRAIFGDMCFDEAYDRYETMLEDGSA